MTNTIKDFLKFANSQKEVSLMIAKDEDVIKKVELELDESHYLRTDDWNIALENLNKGKSCYLILDKTIDKELYDLITQYATRAGIIQIWDKKIMANKVAKFDPFKAHLLLVATENNLSAIEKMYQIRNKVGLVERIS